LLSSGHGGPDSAGKAETGEFAGSDRSDQTVVFGVTADPAPDDAVLLHHRQSAVPEADARRIDIILAFQFLELQTRMRWIALEETPGAPGSP
jgi:hypothetical protein